MGKKRVITMTVYSVNFLTLKERLKVLRRFFNRRHYNISFAKGLILKFNNSIGFADVEEQPITESPGVFYDKKVYANEDYESPYQMLLLGTYFTNKEREIVTFAVEDKRMYCTDKRFSYNPMDIMIKWQNYLYRVFDSDIIIEFSIQDNFKMSLKNYYLSYALTCLAESEIVDNEIPLERPLSKKEAKSIERFFSKNLGIKGTVYSFWCDTCYEVNPDAPYHTSIEYDFSNGFDFL